MSTYTNFNIHDMQEIYLKINTNVYWKEKETQGRVFSFLF